MRASVGGRGELAARVQRALMLPTKKHAEKIVDVVIGSVEETLLNNLGTNGFTLKLGSFGKFSVRHKSGILRRIPFTGETILTKDRRKIRFVSLGILRRSEEVGSSDVPTSRWRGGNHPAIMLENVWTLPTVATETNH